MVRRRYWQSFDCAPRLIQINQKYLDHVPLGHIVTMTLAFLLVSRVAFQAMLVSAIDRSIDRIGQLNKGRR